MRMDYRNGLESDPAGSAIGVSPCSVGGIEGRGSHRAGAPPHAVAGAPVLQILAVAELLGGARLKIPPPSQVEVPFKRGPPATRRAEGAPQAPVRGPRAAGGAPGGPRSSRA